MRFSFGRRSPKKGRTAEWPLVFGVGAAKTGTHSLASMFSGVVPAKHEPDAGTLIKMHLDRVASGNDDVLRQFVTERQRNRPLRLNCSQVNVYLMDDLEALFPGSKYVLTIRPPAHWLRSIVDDSLRRTTDDIWLRFRDYRFGSNEYFPAEEEPLRRRGLYPVRGYLSYWCDAITRVMDRVPPERLFIIETSDLYERAQELAAFCEIENFRPSRSRAHAFANSTRFGIFTELGRNHLIAELEQTCGDLSRRLLPDSSIPTDVDCILAAEHDV